MFYSQFILAKKGPLGTIWIAAHLERKLRKNQVAETDIGVTVDNILFPEVPIALRLSGHLLLGVVRIYSRQVNYLFNDCSETLGKIKQAFHSAAVDLPPEATTAPFHTITLPETFDFDELELGPDSDSAFLYSKGKYVDHHVTTREQITLQDSIQNNPYLGSSQFGLDERFGDGSYSSLGLDFDEEFWASKAGSSSVASTSTPLLKEDTVMLPARRENEVTHMDVDDPYEQPPESGVQRSIQIREAVDTEARQTETVIQLNNSIPTSALGPFNEPGGLETASRKDSDLAASTNDTLSFHAYTPRVLEACTPDLNQEYCPPAEPSTPALAEETSLAMSKECTATTAGQVLPATLGITEKSSSGLPLASSSPQQVSGVNTLASSLQAARSPSPASFQGLPLQQAALAGTNREAFVTQKEKPFIAVEENAASASVPSQSFPQITLMQQNSTPVSHEGAVFPTGTPSVFPTGFPSFSTIPESSQQDGNPSIPAANYQLAGAIHQELYPRFKNEGLTLGSQTPVSSSAAMVELAGTINQEVDERVQEQGLAVGSQNSVSSFGAMIGSTGNVNPGIYGSSPQQRSAAAGSQNPLSLLGAMAGLAGTSNQEINPSVQQQELAVGSQNQVSSLPSFGAMDGVAGTLDDGGQASAQQQGPAITSSNPVSSFGTVAGSVGAVNQRGYPSFQQQGFAVTSPKPVSSLPSLGPVGLAGTVNHGVRVSSQQQGLAVVSPNTVSSLPSLGAMGLAGSVDHGVCVSSQHQGLAVASPTNHQGLAVASPNPMSSLPLSGPIGSAGTVDHGVRMSSQQQGLGVGSPNPVSSFGAMGGSAGTGKQGTHPGFQQQGLEVASPNPVSSYASAMIGPAGTGDHGVHASSQQQGLADGSLNPVSSFGAKAGSAGTVNQGTHPSFQQQGLVLESLPVSSLPLAMAAPAGTADHVVHASPQREGPVAGSSNPVSSFGAIAGTGSQETHPSFQQQGLAVASPNPVAPVSSVGAAMVGSVGTADHGAHASSQQKGLAVASPNPVAPVSSLGAMGGSVGTADHGVHASSQQKGLAVGSPNPMSLFGARAELAGIGSQGTHPSFQRQSPAAASLNPVSSLSSFGAMVGSAGTVDHGAHANSQQQGPAVGSPNSVPSFGAMAGSAGIRSQGTQPSFQHQGPAAASPNLVSSLSSFGDMVRTPGTGSQGLHESLQKQGVAVGSPNQVSSFGAMAGSAGTGSRGTYPNSQQQGPAVAPLNPVSSLSSFGAMTGSGGTGSHGVQASSQQQGFAVGSQNPVSSFGVMGRSTGTANQEAYPSFPQQGPAVGPQNPVSSFGAVVESTVAHPPSTMWNMGASQVLASPFMTEASNAPLFSPSSGSFLPATNALPTRHMESMKSNKETAHETLVSAAFKAPLQPSVTQQVSLSSPTVRPGILPSMRLGEYETLRSAYDLQSRSPGYLMMQKDMSVERIPGLEMERNRSFSVSASGITKEATLPAMDKIPLWREETPSSFTRSPFLPTQSINSLPADDDVLASILGRRKGDFKVVPTPKDAKEPKVNVAKRPKRAPRVTPKKRKIEIDTVAVLHGDVIRQQLANAEDIRRDRRKAPCTRREVWAFIRECEGQENFDEPTLPELSHDLHNLYHDVLHGREPRLSSSALNGGPSSSALIGAVKANQPSESLLIRTGETDSLVPEVNKDTNMLGPRSESNHEVDCTNKDFNGVVCTDQFDGHENNLSESLTGQSNEDAKIAIAQANHCVSSIEEENAENPSAKEFCKPEAGSEGLAGKERDGIASPEVQGLEVYNPSSIISRETEANEQTKQILSLDRGVEAPVPTQRDILVSSLSENVVGIIGAHDGIAMPTGEGIAMTMQKDVLNVVGGDVGAQEVAMTMQKDALGVVNGDVGGQEIATTMQKDALGVVNGDVGTQEGAMTMQKDVLGALGEHVVTQERAMAVQRDTERLEENQQLSFRVLEHEAISLGKEIDFKALDVPSDGKDLTEVPMSDEKDVLEVPLLNVADLDRGNMEGSTEVPMSDRKDVHEMPVPNVIDIEKGNMEGRTEVPMSDGKDVAEVPLLNVVDMDKGNMEASVKLLDVVKGSMEGIDSLPTSNVTEEEINRHRGDEDIVAMECERDTDYLDDQDDDNDVAFAEIDYSSDEQDASIQDSNGWSARSRNVGRYLKTAFEEMEGNSKRLEQPTLALERLLARKTKREAARMFFETLVLKTKDYIHVEQNVAYQEIHLFPRSKLMKTEF